MRQFKVVYRVENDLIRIACIFLSEGEKANTSTFHQKVYKIIDNYDFEILCWSIEEEE